MKIARQDGVALLLTLVMLLVVSMLAASLMFTAQSETWSSMNYRLMTQAKYGAEAGIHRAANYLLNTYAAPADAGADPIVGVYTMTASPVTINNNPVVLSSNADVAANYPVAAVSTAFRDAVQGTFTAGNSVVTYTASATLTSMKQITVYGSATPVAVQTWTITGYGMINGARNAQIEVSTVIERQVVPVFAYAAFATSPACAAMRWSGNPHTDSYNSTSIVWSGGQPVTQASGGNVGTNGNLTESGGATINGTLSTPRSGVGACSAGNITALTQSGGAAVTGGIVNLPQEVLYPTPDLPNPLPPTTAYNTHANITLTPGDYGNIRTGGERRFTCRPDTIPSTASICRATPPSSSTPAR
jgi:Tfp pilus assembly protein PilX